MKSKINDLAITISKNCENAISSYQKILDLLSEYDECIKKISDLCSK